MTPASEVEAVFFDLDATLIDRAASLARYAGMLVSDFTAHTAPVALDDAVRVVRAADGDGYRDREGFLSDILSSSIWTQPPGRESLREHFFETFADLADLTEGATGTLRALRRAGLKLGIVTNGGAPFQSRKVAASGLGALVDDVVISGAVGVHKPDRAIFELALARLEVAAGRSWFVGDHPLNDVIGAAEAGLSAVWFEGVHPWPEDRPPPRHRTRLLADLPAILGLSR
ncbi:MAG: HAD family hydrolase [Chloroflexi bacterium]|nr:HAD family hydrolase [Chloroflexota bacterium]